MSEGTNVGNIYLGLVVRDTVEKQVQNIAAKGQQTAQKAFAGMERTAENAANNVASQAGRAAQRTAEAAANSVKKATTCTAEAGSKMATSLNGAFSKPVEIAKLRLQQLEKEFADLSVKAETLMRNDTSFKMYGYVSESNKAFAAVEAQLDRVYHKMEAARERLAIEVKDSARKQAEAEMAAAKKAAAAAARSADKRAAAERKAAEEAEKAAQKAAKAEEKTANRRKTILASMWKNMLSHAGSSAKSITGKITDVIKRFTTAGKATRRFGSRLREIVRGALIFNGISAALRSMVGYMGESITASDSMKKALANLKGAAANAASPLLQVLTPALTKMANAAATALTYVERLMSRLTGKVSNAAATASKSTQKAVNSAKQAQRTLMGFDTLNRIDGKTETTADDGTDESDSIKPNYSYKGFSSFLESALAAVEAGRWTQVGELIAGKLNGILAKVKWDAIQQKVKAWTGNLTDTLNGFVSKVDWPQLGSSVGNGLNTLTTIVDTFFQRFDWKGLGAGFATGMNRLLDTVDWAQLGRALTDKLMALFAFLRGFIHNFDFAALGSRLGQLLNSAVKNINWDQLWVDIRACLAGLFDGICAFFAELEPDTISVLLSLLFIKAFKGAYETLGPIIAESLGKKLVESLPKVFEQWTTALKNWATGTLLPKITGWITGTLVPKVTTALYAIASTLGISVGWVVAIGAAIAALVVLVVKNWDKIVEWTKKTWQKIKDVWNAAPEWFNEKIIEPVVSFFSDLWHRAQEQGEEAWTKMRQTWQNVSGWFQQHVVQPIRDAFASVYSFVSEIWSAIVSFIKNAVNNVIGSINGMISGIVNGINTVIRALNRLSFTVPEWLRHVPGAANIAGKRFGFDLKTLTAPQIPYLADGGVIKQPTLAMVGEYSGASNNPEIVAPQSLIAETVASVMNDMMQRNQMSLAEIASILRQILNAVVTIGSGGIQIIIGGKEVFQVVVDENNRAILRNGKSPLKV